MHRWLPEGVSPCWASLSDVSVETPMPISWPSSRQQPRHTEGCEPARKTTTRGQTTDGQVCKPRPFLRRGWTKRCTEQERRSPDRVKRHAPKNLSSRATRCIRCRPSPSPTVNVCSMSACPGRARPNLGGSSRRLAPMHTRTRTHAHAHARAHTPEEGGDKHLPVVTPSITFRIDSILKPIAGP